MCVHGDGCSQFGWQHGGMSREALRMYRYAFHNMHNVFVDEVGMVSSANGAR
jgi:hypothetical protein